MTQVLKMLGFLVDHQLAIVRTPQAPEELWTENFDRQKRSAKRRR
jgi:hypothetical protein